MFRALGLVEVVGSADAIQVVDVMVKTSDVEFQTLLKKQKDLF